jgi:hypothetical protein
MVASAQRVGKAAPLLARELRRIRGDDLQRDVIRPEVSVLPAPGP